MIEPRRDQGGVELLRDRVAAKAEVIFEGGLTPPTYDELLQADIKGVVVPADVWAAVLEVVQGAYWTHRKSAPRPEYDGALRRLEALV